MVLRVIIYLSFVTKDGSIDKHHVLTTFLAMIFHTFDFLQQISITNNSLRDNYQNNLKKSVIKFYTWNI